MIGIAVIIAVCLYILTKHEERKIELQNMRLNPPDNLYKRTETKLYKYQDGKNNVYKSTTNYYYGGKN